MFLQDTGDTSPESLKDILSSLRDEITGMQSAILNFEVQAKKITADIFGQGTAFADSVRVSMASAAASTAELGLRVDDVASLYGAIAGQLRTNVMLSDAQLTTFLEFQKATNVTAEQMGILVEGFATLGVGPEKAAKQMSEMAKTSRQYGLNTAQFMEKVGENLKLMNSYNFRDGVEGFTRMVARSQALRINMADVTGLAAKLLDPSEAINLAAQFQVLGGAVGALADPFQLMNMAQNDIEGLQNTILDAASAAVSFNETTGDFQIGATEMRRLRAQAEALGMDYEELANTAVKTAERNQKLEYLQFLSATEEEKEMLASLGQLEGGEVKVKVQNDKGEDIMVSASEALTKYSEQLEQMTREAGLDDRKIALRQMNALEEIQRALEDPIVSVQAEIAGSEAFSQIRNSIKGTAEALSGMTKTLIGDEKNVATAINNFYSKFTEGVESFSKDLKTPETYSEMVSQFETVGGKLVTKAAEASEKFFGTDFFDGLSMSLTNGLSNFNWGSVIPTSGGNTGGGNIPSPSSTTAMPVDLVKVTTTDPIKIDPLTMNFDPLTVNHGGTIQLQGVGGFNINQLTPTELQELSTKLKSYMDPSNILGT